MDQPTTVTPTATGSFTKTPFAHVLVYLHAREMSGTLDITSGERTESLYVQKGCPAKLRSSEPSDPLGRVLLDLGLIDEPAFDSSVKALAAGQGLQGQILLSMGLIQMPALIRGLKEQLTRKLLRLFQLPTASYAYYDGVNSLHGYGGDEILRIDPFPVLYTGVRASYDDARLEVLLGPVGDQRFKLLSGADVGRFGLSRDELDICATAGRPVTVPELLQDSPLPLFQTRALLYCLLITKQVEFVAPQSEQTAPDPTASQRIAASTTSSQRVAAPPSSSQRVAAPPSSSQRVAAPPSSSQRVAAPPAVPTPKSAPTPSDSSYPLPVRRRSAPAIAVAPTDDPELEERRQEIIARAARIETQSYFEMLGVPKDATPELVRDTYFKLAKVYHPDRAMAGLADLKETLEYIFSNISEAHLTLTDRDKRTRYQSLLKEGGGTLADQRKIQSVVDAAMNYQKADVCLRRRDYVEAQRLCALALAAYPDDPEYQALAAWIEFHTRAATDNIDDLIDRLRAAQASAKDSEKTNFYLATALKRAGQEQQAMVHFRRASAANPRNLDALREIRLFEMRKERGATTKKEDSGGIFGRFFKK